MPSFLKKEVIIYIGTLNCIKLAEGTDELKQFKLKRFTCIKVEYKQKRICKMQFVEE